ncbi:MAG TPA: hypothetical protein VM778_02035 [Gemmatimonadota bacterium]|nr:hypothetical protein [Gemmatimonadota bacterium]
MIPVLAAVVRRGDDYLLARRPAHKRHGGLWEVPGGKLRDLDLAPIDRAFADFLSSRS